MNLVTKGYKFCGNLQDLTLFQIKFLDLMLELENKAYDDNANSSGVSGNSINTSLRDKVNERQNRLL